MTHNKIALIVVYALCLGSTAKPKGRIKRELRFPKGGSFVAAVALSSSLPKGPTDGLVHVLEFDLGFPFPEEFSIEGKQAQKKVWRKSGDAIKPENWYKPNTKPRKRKRTKRNSKEEQRKGLLFKIEDAINRKHHPVKCVQPEEVMVLKWFGNGQKQRNKYIKDTSSKLLQDHRQGCGHLRPK